MAHSVFSHFRRVCILYVDTGRAEGRWSDMTGGGLRPRFYTKPGTFEASQAARYIFQRER